MVEPRIEPGRRVHGSAEDGAAVRQCADRVDQVDVGDHGQLVAARVHEPDRRREVACEGAFKLGVGLPGVPHLEVRIDRPRRLLAEGSGGDRRRKRRRARGSAVERKRRRARRSAQLERLLVAAENRLVVHDPRAAAQHGL